MNIISRWRSRGRLVPSIILTAAALLALPAWLSAQTTSYALEGPVTGLQISVLGDSILLGTTGALFLSSYLLEAKKPAPLVAGLSTANIPAFDRIYYSTQYSSTQSYISDGTVAAVALLPLILVPGADRNDIITAAVVYSESLAVSYVAKNLIKSLVVRYRPYAYAATVPSSFLSGTDIEDSFPSGHVTVAFAAAVTGGMLFDAYDSKPLDRALYWGSALGLAAGTAVLRVTSGNHFISDVVAGAAVGSAIGFLVPYLHRTKNQPGTAASGGGPAFLSYGSAGAAAMAEGSLPLLSWSMRW